MSLNPLRDTLAQAGRNASRNDTPFRAEADAALSGFQAVKRDLERRVKLGEITVHTARDQAAEAASRLRGLLIPRAEGYSPVSRAFLDRVIAATESRRAAESRGSIESLQRETNRLLRQTLTEQQLTARVPEFEGRTFVRSMTGGNPSPTLESLLRFHEDASRSGDEPAVEWGRRQLEAMRIRAVGDEAQRRIDAACDRPDRLNPRIVARYVEAMADASTETLEQFVTESIGSKDANACAASFALAREAPEGTASRWVRLVLEGLETFPDAALNTLRAWESEARSKDEEAARARAEYAASLAEAEARLAGLEAPSTAEVDRIRRDRARPIAEPGEPIGLALRKRGILPDDAPEITSGE